MILLDQLSPGDEIEILGNKFTVTNQSRDYRIGCKDIKGFIHYFKRETPIRKVLKRCKA